MKNNKVAQISDYNVEKQFDDTAWLLFVESMETVLTLHRVNPKAIERSGKTMKQALYDMFDCFRIYKQIKDKE